MSKRLKNESSTKRRLSATEEYQSIFRPETMFGLQKFYHLLSPIFEQPVQEAIMREIVWTEEEMCNRMKDFEKGSGLPFWSVLVSRVRTSIAGQFISEFNKGLKEVEQTWELDLDIVKAALTDLENQEEFDEVNNIVDDMYNLVLKIIRSETDNVIYLKTFLGYLDMLRLTDSKVGSFDKHLIQLNTLQVLVLTGNLIEELRFDCLPESLRVLELHNNLISEIKIEKKIEPKLLYLGLSTNCFSDESVIEGLLFLDKLCVFDLSNNNFSSFIKVAQIIQECSYLECICLKGNPLSTVVSYKEIIKTSSPKLHQLDGASLMAESEKELVKKTGNKDQFRKTFTKKEKIRFQERKLTLQPSLGGLCYTAELRIHVFKMLGIPKPQIKNKKFKGYFQFEVQLPLLDQRYKVQKKCRAMFALLQQTGLLPSFPPLDEITDEAERKMTPRKPPKSPQPENHLRNRKHSERQKKKEYWETEYEEFLANDDRLPDVCSILSEKIRWAPIIKLNKPIAIIPVSSARLGQLRYTLKSIIVIRLYLHYEGSKDDSNTEKKLIAKISVPAQEPHWREEFCNYEWNAKLPQIATFLPTTANAKFPPGVKDEQNDWSWK
nr:uncharacterized protein LOC106689705 isoform X3 [Halyomorpha halys]